MENNDYENLLKNKLNEIDSKINRNKYIEKKFEYKIKKRIFEILQELGAGIFGGSIRDQILHESASKKFYQYYEKYTNDNMIVIPHNNNDDNNIRYIYNKIFLGKPVNITYCDKNFHSETYLDRNTIMNDIDCVINENLFERLIKHIEKIDNSIKIYTKKYNNFKNYIHIKDSSKIIKSYITIYISAINKFNHIKHYLTFNECIDADLDLPIFKPIYFKIDIFIYDDSSNIFQALNLMSANSDYFCNSLYMINNRLSINDNIAKSIIRPNYESNITDIKKRCLDIFIKKHLYKEQIVKIIINQIYNRNAYPVKCNIIGKRILKMSSKNFKILDQYNFFDNVILHEEICILCRDNINSNNENIKLICCNSCYHQNCFKDIVYRHKYEIKRCYMCSTKINFKYIYLNYYT